MCVFAIRNCSLLILASFEIEIQPKNFDSPEKLFHHRQQIEPPKKCYPHYEYNSMQPEYNPVPFQHHQQQPQAIYENHYHEPTLAIT